ncbi:MAG: hypothetical protein ACJAT2_001073 [Bacteriovoracaceae bacterium]|jgi:hypothetical protein
MFLDFFYFLLRYTPWWGVPTIMMAVSFAYIWWLKENWPVVFFCAGLVAFSSSMLIFYIWAGSPSQAVHYFREMIHAVSN